MKNIHDIFGRIMSQVLRRNGQTPKNHNEEYTKWYRSVVNTRGRSVDEVFQNFDHVVEVDWNKFFNHSEPFAWVPNEEAKRFLWPAKEMGECTIWNYFRVIRNEYTGEWEINEIGGHDLVFVATNSEEDAIMIALMFS